MKNFIIYKDELIALLDVGFSTYNDEIGTEYTYSTEALVYLAKVSEAEEKGETPKFKGGDSEIVFNLIYKIRQLCKQQSE